MGRGQDVSVEERAEIRRRYLGGERAESIAAELGRHAGTIYVVMRQGAAHQRRAPRRVIRSARRLSLAEREEISRGLRGRESLRVIAARLHRAPSTLSREVRAGGGRSVYRAWQAERAAIGRAKRPKPAKLATNAALRLVVEALLELRWSPAQIAARLRHDHSEQPEMWVSAETIYQSLFVQGRGALRAELARCLRSGRAERRPRWRGIGPRNQVRNMVLISERPAEVEDRAVPGHWEGDLLMGARNNSAIGTLVERRTRYVMLIALPHGRTAEAVRDALAEHIVRLPEELRRSLTWDRGKEMAEHVRFTVDTGVQVYFCDPHSPWQRGTNENTNGLLRQYFPKGTDLSSIDQAQLDAVARELNGRPRQTLGWLQPSEAFAEVVASIG
jgi:transposase, IS30 family